MPWGATITTNPSTGGGHPGRNFHYWDITGIANADTDGPYVLSGFMKSNGTTLTTIGGNVIQAVNFYSTDAAMVNATGLPWIEVNAAALAASVAILPAYTYVNAAGETVAVAQATFGGAVPIGGAWKFHKAAGALGAAAVRVVAQTTD